MSSSFLVRSGHVEADASQKRSSSPLRTALQRTGTRDVIRPLRRTRALRSSAGASVVELGLLVVAIAAVIAVLVLALTSVIRSGCDSSKKSDSSTSQSC